MARANSGSNGQRGIVHRTSAELDQRANASALTTSAIGSHGDEKNRMEKRRILVVLAALSWGCSDEAVGKRTPPTSPGISTEEQAEYSIKFYVDRGNGPKLQRALPADLPEESQNKSSSRRLASADKAVEEPSAGAEELGKIRQAAIINDGSPFPDDTNVTDDAYGYVPGSTLLMYAVESCWEPLGPPPNYHRSQLTTGTYVIPPWSGGEESWFTFSFQRGAQSGYFDVPHFMTCDQQLYAQETLLCAADRLAQLGDSPGTVTWEGNDGEGSTSTSFTVQIPPQAAADKFIARDMAFNVLAHIASLDERDHKVFSHTSGDEDVFVTKSCDQWYKDIAEDGIPFDENGNTAAWKGKTQVPTSQSVGYSYYAVTPEQTLYFDDILINSASRSKTVGQNRIERRALLLSASARLLRDLVERSVVDDRAGAEKLKANAGDPARGLELYWGGPLGLKTEYNTAQHAMRTLFGRLEMFDNGALEWEPGVRLSYDPRCSRDDVTGDLELGLGPPNWSPIYRLDDWHSAHWTDVPPSTTSQGRLLAQLDRAGIIVPESGIQNLPEARTAVLNELLLQAAVRASGDPATNRSTISIPTFANTDIGKAIKADFGEYSDEDLRFALRRMIDAYNLVVPFALLSKTSAANHGVAVESFSALSGSSVNGFVAKGGLNRQDISGDVFGKVFGAQEMSQCGYDGDYASRAGSVAAFQNVFSLGEAFSRRLGSLVVDAEAVDAAASTLDFANAAYTEARQWSGGRVVRENWGNGELVTLVGFAPQDFGATTEQEFVDFGKALVYTYGYDGWRTVADCVAGLRETCPPASTLAVWTVAAEDAQVAQTGLVLPNLEILFPVDNLPGWMNPVTVVLPKGTKFNSGRGMVLAHIGPSSTSGSDLDEYQSEVVSPAQRRLVNSLFSLGQAERPQRTCGNVASASLPDEYCIPGMRRDMFVPLANEITSAGTGTEDSWKHYLQVAKDSAAKADSIAKEMLDLGLQRDIRQEGATAAVGEICGSFPQVDGFESSGGLLSLSDEDGAINQCLNEELVDLVYFRMDPWAGRDTQDTWEEIWDLYCVASNPLKPPFCSKTRGSRITHGALNIDTKLPNPPPYNPDDPYADCGAFAEVWDAETHEFDRQTFDAYTTRSWASGFGGYVSALSQMKLVMDTSAHWAVTMGGTVVMGSKPKVLELLGENAEQVVSVWPACGAPEDCDAKGKAVAKLFVPPSVYGDTSTYASVQGQVESAIFYLGALAGGIPPGVFNMPLLAANRAEDIDAVAAPAMYAHGVFEEDPDGYYRLVQEGYEGTVKWSSQHTPSAGAWLPLASGSTFAQRRLGSQASPPMWLTRFYTQVNAAPSKFLAMNLENAEIPFHTALPTPSAAGGTESTRGENLFWYLRGLGALAENDATCEDQGELYNLVVGATRTDNPRYWGPTEDRDDGPGVRQVCGDAPGGPVFVTKNHGSTTSLADPGFFVTDKLAFTWSGSLQSIDGFPYSGDRSVAESAGDKSYGGTTFLPEVWRSGFAYVDNQPEECTEDDGLFWEVGSGRCAQYPWPAKYSFDVELEARWGMTCEQVTNTTRHLCTGPNVHRIAHERLSPTLCPAPRRMEMFLNRNVTNNCDAMSAVHRAMGLSCLAESAPGSLIPTLPPVINEESDLVVFQAWLGQYARIMHQATAMLYITNVPQSVLIAAGGVNQAAASQGEQGKLLLEIGKNLNHVEGRLSDIAGSFRTLERAVWTARNSIQIVRTDAEKESLSVSFTELETGRQIALEEAAQSQALIKGMFGAVMGAAGGASGFASAGGLAFEGSGLAGNGLGAIFGTGASVFAPWIGAAVGAAGAITDAVQQAQNAGTSLGALRSQQQNLRQQHQVIQEGEVNRVEAALIALNDTSDGAYQMMEESVRGVEDAQATILQNLATYSQNRAKGTFALAQASGADFFQTGSRQIPLRVNTVYRRQFDVLRQRYDRALDSAKRAAYLARLAIEERLGTRLDDLDAPLGPLEAPSLWVDDLCSLQGVDYDALRTATPPAEGDADEAAELDLIKGFSDQYIGDYVDRLSEFVEFYNLQFPFREGDDQTVLSLREDLGSSQVRCERQANNLLFWSDKLTARAPLGENGRAPGAWRPSGCSSAACLDLAPAQSLVTMTQPLVSPPGGAATWLRTRSRDTENEPMTEQGPAPSNVVYQTVTLRAGQRYVLSWWDIARGATGDKPQMGDVAQYSATVYDAGWSTLDTLPFTAEAKSTPAWSARREMAFVAAVDGDYHITFSPSSAKATTFSIAIAGVQLEEAVGDSIGATAYEPTTEKRLVVSGNCPVDTPEAFRARFDYRCASGRCFYELRDPLVIDTEILSQRFSSLIGKVAAGNYNYRNTAIALNIVGTGVADCSLSDRSSCYAQGYLEYDLDHQAFSVPIEDQEKQVRCFDFGIGHVFGGKALATERFLTTPLGSADRDLISQASITKNELGGRPLSGSYRLRIYDNPALAWGNVEDVQVLLDYRFWSAVDRSASP